ncbi:MAG: FHA domain-containing protein [Negativicutes bacterium]|nr:FHA domain-containing protein [Negativicutes bacterium]
MGGLGWQQIAPAAIHYILILIMALAVYRLYRVMLGGQGVVRPVASLAWKIGDQPHSRQLTGNVTIGRGPQNFIVIDDEAVSFEHAVIAEYPDGFMVSDLQSTNGTLINGQKLLGPRMLKKGDRITVGNTVLTFRAGR